MSVPLLPPVPPAVRTAPTDVAAPHADLLGQVAQGDQAAFAALYDATAGRVHGLVLRVVRDPAQAEEVTQEVYLAVWEGAAAFDPARGSAWSWLSTIAHRRAVDRVRSSQASRRREAQELQLLEPLRRVRETVDPVVAAVEALATRDVLAALTPAQREAIELAYFEGHTHTEVSAILGIPLGTAKSRIRDGLRALRDSLTPAA